MNPLVITLDDSIIYANHFVSLVNYGREVEFIFYDRLNKIQSIKRSFTFKKQAIAYMNAMVEEINREKGKVI